MLAQKPETLASFLNPRQTVQLKDLIMVGKKDTCERIEWPCGDSVVPWTPVGPIWGLMNSLDQWWSNCAVSSVRWDMCFGKGGNTHSPNHQSRNNTCGLKVMSGLWRLLRPGWVGYKKGTNSTLWFLKGAFNKRCFHFVPWIGREKLIHIVSILPSRLQWTWMVTGFDSYRAISDQTHFSMTWEAAHEQEILC